MVITYGRMFAANTATGDFRPYSICPDQLKGRSQTEAGSQLRNVEHNLAYIYYVTIAERKRNPGL